MAPPRKDLTPAQAVEAWERHGSTNGAARELRTTAQTVRRLLAEAGVAAYVDPPMDERDIPPQHMPTFEICKLKVGRSEALRMIRDHIERRG